MNKGAKQNILLLIVAGAVFIAANTVIFMGVKSGRIAPVDDLFLWGAFAAMSVCSLLWAVSLLGLQPIVVAVSYAAGGFLAFYGVRLTPDVNVAEIATSGATYGAFGALVVGNATAKVRLAFFSKKQVPFIAVILGLLLVDGLLNSRVSNAGWHVITNAVVFPFLFCGVIVGLVWVMISKAGAPRVKSVQVSEATGKSGQDETPSMANEDAAELMFSVPEGVDGAVAVEREAVATEHKAEDTPAPMETVVASVSDVVEPVRDEAIPDSFFPLDIDEGEEHRIEENPELLGLAEMVARSAPEPVAEPVAEPVEYRAPEPVAEPVAEPVEYRAPEPVAEPVAEPVEYRAPEPVAEPVSEPEAEEHNVSPAPERPEVIEDPTPEEHIDLKASEKEPEPDSEEGKAGSESWLNSHLDLLNKLK